MFSQLLSCLAYLHRKGVVASTLALTSVLVANARSPVLLDVEQSDAAAAAAAAARSRSSASAAATAAAAITSAADAPQPPPSTR
eukprot:1157723-Prorocentrum_minimum.AAC.3